MYLEGMEEASVFVHVAVNDITGKVGTTKEMYEKICSLCSTIEISSENLDFKTALHFYSFSEH